MELQRSSLTNRMFASLIDYLVLTCFYILFVYNFGEPNDEGGYTVTGLLSLIPILFWFVYFIIIEGIFSATIGHFILGLKVVKINNQKINIIDSLKRHLLDIIDFFPFGIPAIISIKNTTLNQRLGDLWAKTIVIIDKEK